MRLFLDSFQHQGSSLLPKKWTQVTGAAITTTGGPGGSYGCTLGTLSRTIPASLSLAASWKFKIDVVGSFGTGQICQFLSVSSNHNTQAPFVLQLENDGTLSIYGGNTLIARTSGADALHASTFYLLEVNCQIGFDAGTGRVQITPFLRINGVTKLSPGLSNTNLFVSGLLSGNASVTMCMFGGSNLGVSTIGPPVIYDNQTDVGAHYNMTSALSAGAPVFWAGDYTGGCLFPRADVLTQWAHTGGDTFSQLLSNPPNLAKFASSATAAQKDALFMDAAASLPIVTVQVCVYSKKTDSGTREVSIRSGAGATEIISPTFSLSDDPVFLVGGRDSDPADGNQWTKAKVDAKAFGFNLNL